MYHLRLNKALSYSGVVSATKENPDVFVDDESNYRLAMESGFFDDITGSVEETVVDDTEQIEDNNNENDNPDMHENPLDSMSATELKAYAAVNGIDIGKKKSRDDILKIIKEAEAHADEVRKTLVNS